MMTKPLIISLLWLFFSSSSALSRTLVDRLAAEVDGIPITYNEVMDKVNKGARVLVSPYPAEENAPPYEVALRDLINTQLVMKKAVELDIEFTEEEIMKRIQENMQEQNLTMDQLIDLLKKEGVNFDDYRRDFKTQLIFSRLMGIFIFPQVQYTEKELETFYMRTNGITADNVKVDLQQIFLPVDAATLKAKTALANSIIKKLDDGLSFADAVKQFSEPTDAASKGGAMPTVALKDLSGPFREALTPLEKGQHTKPIVTESGIYIFYVADKNLAKNEDFAKKRQELEYKFREEKAARQLNKWLAEQQLRSRIKIIADKAS